MHNTYPVGKCTTSYISYHIYPHKRFHIFLFSLLITVFARVHTGMNVYTKKLLKTTLCTSQTVINHSSQCLLLWCHIKLCCCCFPLNQLSPQKRILFKFLKDQGEKRSPYKNPPTDWATSAISSFWSVMVCFAFVYIVDHHEWVGRKVAKAAWQKYLNSFHNT